MVCEIRLSPIAESVSIISISDIRHDLRPLEVTTCVSTLEGVRVNFISQSKPPLHPWNVFVNTGAVTTLVILHSEGFENVVPVLIPLWVDNTGHAPVLTQTGQPYLSSRIYERTHLPILKFETEMLLRILGGPFHKFLELGYRVLEVLQNFDGAANVFMNVLAEVEHDTSVLHEGLVFGEVGAIVTRPKADVVARVRLLVADERTVLVLPGCRGCIHVGKRRTGGGEGLRTGAERLAASSCSRVLYENPVVRPSHPPEMPNIQSLCSVSPRASRVPSSFTMTQCSREISCTPGRSFLVSDDNGLSPARTVDRPIGLPGFPSCTRV